MKNLENINFEGMDDLLYVLRMDKEKLVYKHREEMIDAMKNSDKLITVHLYPFSTSRKKEQSLIEMDRWSYHQLYICINNNKIFYSCGHGDTNGSRENHNFFIDKLLGEEELRSKIPTAVIVTHKRDVISYYFYKNYAYSNHDIGSNWDAEIRKRLRESKLPYSCLNLLENGKEVIFKTRKKEIIVYRALKEDISWKKFQKKLKLGI